MAIEHLTEEQIKTWTSAQKDEWWLRNVYRGDMPQLTLRSGVMGFLLGGILAATAMYILAKSGIGIGVGLTSVLLSFAFFRVVSNMGIAKDFTILENNCTQSIATSAGYVIAPLGAGLAAYMVMTGHVLPWWQMVVWLIVVSVTGVLIAFPMKRRFINEDQLPFPEGRACGVVLDSLYTGGAEVGITPIGLRVVAQAQKVLEEGANLREIARQGHDPLEGPLRVGVIYTVGPYLLPYLVPEQIRRTPQMPLLLQENYTARLLELLRQGEIDCAIVALPLPDSSLAQCALYDGIRDRTRAHLRERVGVSLQRGAGHRGPQPHLIRDLRTATSQTRVAQCLVDGLACGLRRLWHLGEREEWGQRIGHANTQ